MDKFNLNEAFDKVFELSLQEKLNEDIEDLCEMFNNENNDFLDTITILQEAMLLEFKEGDGSPEEEPKEEDKKKITIGKKDEDKLDKLDSNLDSNHLNTISNIYSQAMAQYDKMTKNISDKAMEKRIEDKI